MTLELTNEEANALAQLLDIAVKAGGIQVAQAAIPLFAKLQEAVKKPQEMNDE